MSQSFAYKFERVRVKSTSGTYKETIHARAIEGWRLVQVLIEQPAAMASEYVLILERPTLNQD